MSEADTYDNQLRDCLKSNQERQRCLDSEIIWRKKLQAILKEARELIELAFEKISMSDEQVHAWENKAEQWLEKCK